MIFNDMKLLLAQTSPSWKDSAKSLAAVEALLSSAGHADLVVLPEMFVSGFVTEPGESEETSGPEGLAWMMEYARTKGCAVAGSLSTRTPEGFRNRFHFVFPDGSSVHYDKRHLFTFSGEHLRYVPGRERTIVEYLGFRILLQVCYDLRFPVFSRNRLVEGRPEYDLILYVASWPGKRIDAWDALLRARAIENLCYVAGVNRVGDDPGNTYPGHTTLISPRGEMLSICKENVPDTLLVDISRQELDEFRASFPALSDADRM